jgi:putative Ca2+/H+ antiporter (TMEM165/GDT1 family)
MARRSGLEEPVNAFLVSTGVVALAEMGDKTQLLAFLLASRFRKPLPIVLGILVATLANHALAGLAGSYVTSLVRPDAMRWILGISFIGMAAWTLIPDKLSVQSTRTARAGAFATTLLAFFLMEMGDKTQIATVALAAQYQSLPSIVAGTTLGMMLANVPAVVVGDRFAHRLPIGYLRVAAAAIFALLGVATLFGAGAAAALH